MEKIFGLVTGLLNSLKKWGVSIFRKRSPDKEIFPEPEPELSPELSPEPGGGLFRLWSWGLPLLLGCSLGWFGTVCLEVWLNGVNAAGRPVTASAGMTEPGLEPDAASMAAFLRANPFKVTPMAVPEFSGTDALESGDAAVPIVGSLATALLKGTSPGFVAWMEDQGKLRLVLVGESFDVYTLEEVTYTDATFIKDDNRVVKELIYGGPSTPVSVPAPGLPDARTADAGPVVAPDPGSNKPGEISRNMVNQLLENPFDELKKIRLRPSENEQGLQIQWINKDSILAQLGVQKDDVIRAINGIPFRNVMDISNSLSSLMASDQFVVEVTRGGASTSLQYVVR
jgi:type II secretory pathway component PulC